jgi:hypothetical protein
MSRIESARAGWCTAARSLLKDDSMKTVFAALLLAGAIASSPAHAADGPQVFTAYTTGELSIDAEGRVVDLSIDRKRLDVDVMRDVAAQMRQWRFEPILENGRPVAAKAAMNINLVAVRDPGVDGFRVAFESVHFRDLARNREDRAVSNALASPRFPFEGQQRGVGAKVTLLLRINDEGRVASVAATSVDLLGNISDSDAGGFASQFVQASEKITALWAFSKYKGRSVFVPIRFHPRGTSGERWIRTLRMPIEVPAWAVAEQSATGVVALGLGGIESSERWKLVTPLGG